jgi:Arc-like DNA binding domain
MTRIEKRRIRLETRLPVEVREWLADRAEHFGTSINAQIIVAVRREMEREQALERK